MKTVKLIPNITKKLTNQPKQLNVMIDNGLYESLKKYISENNLSLRQSVQAAIESFLSKA